ncbi:MAG: phycobiliprotein lyase, partial [Synechocystis sp.]
MQFLDFITAWEGKWLSQRTNYNFDQNEAANDKSDVTVDRLAVHDAAVQGLQA